FLTSFESVLSTFDQIPPIAVKILEHDDGAVFLVARLFDEPDAMRSHRAMIAPEIVGVDEQKNASTGLITDAAGLHFVDGLGKQQRRAAVSGGSDDDPAFTRAARLVFDEVKSQ